MGKIVNENKKKEDISVTVEWRVARQGVFPTVPLKQENFHSCCQPQKF